MSTRGSVWFDTPTSTMEWTPMARPWCKSCCVPHCGCPYEPELVIPPNVVLGEE